MNDDEDDASESERAEAEALRRALDGEASAQPPEDALGAALFLRHAGARGELAPERAEAILHDLLRDAPLPAQPSPRARVLRMWPLAAALGAAAVVFVLLRTRIEPEPASGKAPLALSAVPAASMSLLAAQADLVRQISAPGPDDVAAARYDRELRAYRAQVLRALQAAYPAPVGMLEPQRRAP